MTKQSNVVSLEETKIYKKNLAALKEHYPELAKQISQTFLSKYRLVQDKPGKLPNLLIETNSRYYYRPDDPMQDAKEQIDELNLKNNRLAVFLGTGLGYELIYYIQEMLKAQNTSHILIIEKELEVFKAAMLITDLSSMISNKFFHFMVGLPKETLYVKLRNYLSQNSRFMFLKAMKPVYHSSSIMIDKAYYMNALKQLRESGTHQVFNYGNSPHDSLVGIEHMFANINEIIFNPGINLLFDKFTGNPAVVVSAGPSLNRNKNLLKGLEDKALIVCPDTSLSILLDLGVKPHLVTSLERFGKVSDYMQGHPKEQVKDVYYAACPVISPEAYRVYNGPRLIVYRNFDHFKWLGVERGILDIKRSSGNMAFKVAAALGCDPIILIGQDLAFGRDGYTHATGHVRGKEAEKNKLYSTEATFEVPGNDGNPILTSERWYTFLKGYEVDIANYMGTCINSTEGGAYIEGTEVLPFQEAINLHIQEPFKPLVKIKHYLSTFSREEKLEDFRRISTLVNDTISDMKFIINNCNAGLKLYEKNKTDLIKCLSNPEYLNTYRDRLKMVREEMMEPKLKCQRDYHHTFQLFFTHVIQSFTIKFGIDLICLPERHEDKDAALVETLLRHGEWYSVISKLALICLEKLKDAKVRLSESKH